MKENEWLLCTDPERMLQQLAKMKQRPNPRKLRLFATACCRLLWDWFEEPCRRAVEAAERHAEGLITDQELRAAHDAAMRRNRGRFDKQGLLWGRGPEGPHGRIVARWAWEMTEGTTRLPRVIASKVLFAAPFCAETAGEPSRADNAALVTLLREVIGNPFSPATRDPAWLAWNDGTIPNLAQVIYDERRFDDLLILADALEDAGCRDADILNHCRGPGPHVRGCWVVDLLLGKE